MGEGRGSVPVQSSRHYYQRGEVLSSADSDIDLPGNGNHEPLFEGFSFPGKGFHTAHTDYRISVLQSAKCHALALSARSPVVSLRSSPRGSSSNAVAAAAAQRSLGFHGGVCRSFVDSGDQVGPPVAVRCSSSAGGHLSGLPTTRPFVLVQRVGPGLGGKLARPVCLGSLVGRGAELFHQPA